MAKTAHDARKHVREWSAFFRDVGIVPSVLVDEFIEQHRRNKHLRQSLKRLVARGIVRQKQKAFSVTPKGIMFFLKKTPVERNRQEIWDGKWRLVSFDVPLRDNSKRAFLRGLLKEFGFYQLQKSVWVCPSYLTEKFWKLVVHYELDKYCKVMLVEIIEGDEELKKHFKLA